MVNCDGSSIASGESPGGWQWIRIAPLAGGDLIGVLPQIFLLGISDTRRRLQWPVLAPVYEGCEAATGDGHGETSAAAGVLPTRRFAWPEPLCTPRRSGWSTARPVEDDRASGCGMAFQHHDLRLGETRAAVRLRRLTCAPHPWPTGRQAVKVYLRLPSNRTRLPVDPCNEGRLTAADRRSTPARLHPRRLPRRHAWRGPGGCREASGSLGSAAG